MNRLHNKATFAAQKNFSSACFFMPFYLVNPNNCVIHTFERPLINNKERARNIQHNHL